MNKFENAVFQLVEKYSGGDYQIANEYGERGYSKENENRPILFTNWNKFPDHIKNGLERRGYSLQYQDEWVTDHRGYAYRCHGDSYDWSPYFVQSDGEVIGGDEIENNRDTQEWYISTLIDNPDNACAFRINLTEHGFTKCEQDYESGHHPGQTDNPHKILKNMQAEYPDHEFVFGNYRNSQFYVTFNIYRRPV